MQKNNFYCYVAYLLKKYIKIEIAGLFISVLLNIAVVITPYMTKCLIDTTFFTDHFSSVKKDMCIFLSACFFQSFCIYVSTRIIAYISSNFTANIQAKLFQKILKAPLSFFNRTASGTIMSRLVSDCDIFNQFLISCLFSATQNIFFVLLLSICMFLLSPLISFVLYGFLLIYVILNVVIGNSFEKIAKKIVGTRDKLLTTIKQDLNNIELIKTAALEEDLKNDFKYITEALCVTNIKRSKLQAFLGSFNNTIIVLGMAIIYGFGFYLISQKYLTVGSVIAFYIYFQMTISPIRQLIDMFIRFKEAKPVLTRLSEFFDLKTESLSKGNISNKFPSIHFRNVCFKHENTTKFVINNSSFNLVGNGLYGIVGESGSGKSTIAQLILDLYKPKSGKINVFLDNDQAKKEHGLFVRHQIGYVSQNMRLFNKTIEYNLKLNNNSISKDDIINVCRRLNLHEKIISLPEQYKTIISENVDFSGGEMQRLILARTFLKHAKINVLDEATSALDEKSRLKAQELIEEMASWSLVLVISHNLEILRNAKSIIFVQNGFTYTGLESNFCNLKDIKNILKGTTLLK